MTASQLLDEFVSSIDQHLAKVLPQTSIHSQDLVDGMRYAVLDGGKRLRGSLVCATTHALTGSYAQALDCASALECMHAYSLVHDDLPVMDDADLRRGKPSCHRVYGPAMATLIGDALQPLAFSLILESEAITKEKRVEIARIVARAAGWHGMVGGQAFDIQLDANTDLDVEQLRRLHRAKTGEFFVAAVEIGCVVGAESPEPQLAASLRRFGSHLGEAFQVVDDVLDANQSSDVTGKPQGQDQRLGKQTFPVLLGAEKASSVRAGIVNERVKRAGIVGLRDSVAGDGCGTLA